MAWKIEYLASAQKILRKTDPQTRERLREYLENRVAHLENPRQLGKALRGHLSELWRYRVGDHRLICELRDDTLVVLVVRIGHRKDIYEN